MKTENLSINDLMHMDIDEFREICKDMSNKDFIKILFNSTLREIWALLEAWKACMNEETEELKKDKLYQRLKDLDVLTYAPCDYMQFLRFVLKPRE